MESLESRIEAVTVYRSGALITRTAALPVGVAVGPAEVHLHNLPLALDDASLRFRVEGRGALPLVTEASVELDAGLADPSLEPAIDEELEAARMERSRRAAAVDQLEEELVRIERLAPTDRPEPEEGQPPAESPTDARISLLELRATRIRRIHGALADAEETLRQVSEQLAELEERRRRASSAREARENELRKVVKLRLEGGEASAVGKLVIQYLVPGAQWTPSYALRLDESLKQARLEARAMVRHRSGEDWTGVRLVVSTASAQAWTELPELHSLRVGRRQPSPRRSWRPPPTGAAELYSDYDAAFAEPSAPKAPARRAPPPPPAPMPMAEQAPQACVEPPPEVQFLSAGSVPPPSAPMPMASRAAPKPGKKSSSVFGALGGMVDAFSRSRSEAEGANWQAVGEAEDLADSMEPDAWGANAFEAHAEEPAEEPEQALLRYGGLRLASADRQERGRLAPLVTPAHPELERALDRARRMQRRPLPARCQLPDAVGGFDFAIPAEHPADVRADGAFHSIPLAVAEGPAEPRYLCVPRESQDVFRRVVMHSPLVGPVLAGPVDVYVAGDYLLTADLRHTPAAGRIKLGLGVEQAIKVARNVHFEENKAGLIGGALDLEHTVTITLANHLAAPARVEVRERIPVPADKHEDDIDVTVGDVTPEWEEWEPDDRPLRGGRRWRVEVPVAGERTLEANWTVRIPKGNELVGGNRREV